MRLVIRPLVTLFAAVCLVVSLDRSPAQGAERPEVIRNVTYVERESGPVLADLYVPQGEGPFPAVLVIHGGSWSSGDKSQLAFIANRLAMQGYTTVAINYRLAPEHRFPCQVHDCRSAVRWMRTHASQYKIDPQRIGVWGYSAGGHLAAMLGTCDDAAGLDGSDLTADCPGSRVQVVVAGGTPSDFRLLEPQSDRLEYWFGGTRGELPEAYEQASPNCHVTSDDPPMFFYHGDADELVPLISAEAIHQSLKRAGVESQLYVIPKAKHIGAALDGKAIAEGVKFLERYLKPSPN